VAKAIRKAKSVVAISAGIYKELAIGSEPPPPLGETCFRCSPGRTTTS